MFHILVRINFLDNMGWYNIIADTKNVHTTECKKNNSNFERYNFVGYFIFYFTLHIMYIIFIAQIIFTLYYMFNVSSHNIYKTIYSCVIIFLMYKSVNSQYIGILLSISHESLQIFSSLMTSLGLIFFFLDTLLHKL